MLRNYKNRIGKATVAESAADRTDEGIRRAEQPADSDFNNKLDIIKTEFQLQFRKLRDHIISRGDGQNDGPDDGRTVASKSSLTQPTAIHAWRSRAARLEIFEVKVGREKSEVGGRVAVATRRKAG